MDMPMPKRRERRSRSAVSNGYVLAPSTMDAGPDVEEVM